MSCGTELAATTTFLRCDGVQLDDMTSISSQCRGIEPLVRERRNQFFQILGRDVPVDGIPKLPHPEQGVDYRFFSILFILNVCPASFTRTGSWNKPAAHEQRPCLDGFGVAFVAPRRQYVSDSPSAQRETFDFYCANNLIVGVACQLKKILEMAIKHRAKCL